MLSVHYGHNIVIGRYADVAVEIYVTRLLLSVAYWKSVTDVNHKWSDVFSSVCKMEVGVEKTCAYLMIKLIC